MNPHAGIGKVSLLTFSLGCYIECGVDVDILLAVMASVCLWAGAGLYLLRPPTRINPVPWIVWSAASLVASVNTIAEEGWSKQAYIYLASTFVFLSVVWRHSGLTNWVALPRWQKYSLPILLVSPAASLSVSPLVGIALQVIFAWVTASAFIQTAMNGYSRDPVSAWWVELAGCVLLTIANEFVTLSWILPLNSALVSAACLIAVIKGSRINLDDTGSC